MDRFRFGWTGENEFPRISELNSLSKLKVFFLTNWMLLPNRMLGSLRLFYETNGDTILVLNIFWLALMSWICFSTLLSVSFLIAFIINWLSLFFLNWRFTYPNISCFSADLCLEMESSALSEPRMLMLFLGLSLEREPEALDPDIERGSYESFF